MVGYVNCPHEHATTQCIIRPFVLWLNSTTNRRPNVRPVKLCLRFFNWIGNGMVAMTGFLRSWLEMPQDVRSVPASRYDSIT